MALERRSRRRTRSDIEIMAELFTRIRALYQRTARVSGSDRQAVMAVHASKSPTPEELAKEYNGKALKDVTDPKDATKVICKAGEQVAGFA